MKSKNLKETITELNRVLKCNSLKILKNPCPDDSCPRKFVTFNGNSFKDVSKEVTNYINIYFVLESPHIDEYDEDGKPIKAANGDTGQNFNESLIDVLNLLQFNGITFKENKTYGVSIVNAIQYQTSLGYNTNFYRSVIFQLIWNNWGRDDFESRLKLLVKDSNTIIINACTKGNIISTPNKELYPTLQNAKKILVTFNLSSIEMVAKNIDLNKIVDNAITSNKATNQYIRIIHPSRWIKLVVK